MKMKKQFYRHGDVVFHEVESIEGEEVKHNGKYAVALGEATGHSHTLLCETMEIRKNKGRNMVILQEVEIVHQQHKKLKMSGKFAQVQEREADHFADGVIRKVVD